MEVFSKKLIKERELNGYSRKEIADMLGIPQTTYIHYELLGTKEGREPAMTMIVKMADLLAVSIDYLFGRED